MESLYEGKAMSNRDPNPKSDRVSQKISDPSASGHVAVSVGKEEVECESQGESDRSDSSSNEQDVAEIIDLQKALEYLVSERDIEMIYNGNSNQQQKSDEAKPSQSNHDIVTNIQTREDQLYMIPNLINRILMEHYSPSPNNHEQRKHNSDAKNVCMSRKQTQKMTQLLIAVIVEFAEPYFARTARHRQQQRNHKQKQQQEKKKKNAGKKPQTQSGNGQSLSFDFDERAVSWATSCLNQLLLPPTSLSSTPLSSTISATTYNGNMSNNDHLADEAHDIPELDALLAASGPHDGMEMEQRMQSALLHGLQARRLLQNMGKPICRER